MAGPFRLQTQLLVDPLFDKLAAPAALTSHEGLP